MPPFRIRFKFNKLINNLLQRLCFGVLFENFNRWKMNIYKQICFIDPPILTYTHKKRWSIQGLWAELLDGNDLAVKVVWKVTAQCIWIFKVCRTITRTQEPWYFLLLFCIYISEIIEEQKFDNWQNKQHKAKEKEEGWA